LGPLLFLIFINAIGFLQASRKLFPFADDAVLMNVHDLKDQKNAEVSIAQDMKDILDFFNHRGLELNATKMKFVVFSSKSRPVD
jgi:hypothetical protein